MYIYCFIIDLEYVVKIWIPKLYLGFELKPKYEKNEKRGERV
jgi:hypothetical protein